jgi:hypothetical protein
MLQTTTFIPNKLFYFFIKNAVESTSALTAAFI